MHDQVLIVCSKAAPMLGALHADAPRMGQGWEEGICTSRFYAAFGVCKRSELRI